MTVTQPTPELLRQAVFELVEESRKRLHAGEISVQEVERGVRAYCEAVAKLPLEEGREHTKDLESLMQVVTELGNELKVTRDAVRTELEALGRLKAANVAYQRSDAIVEGKKNDKSGS